MFKKILCLICVLSLSYTVIYADDEIINKQETLINNNIQNAAISSSEVPLNRNVYPTVFANLKANAPNTAFSTGNEIELNRGKYVENNHKTVLLKFDLGASSDYQTSQVYVQFTSTQLTAGYDFGYYVYGIPKTVAWDDTLTYTGAAATNSVICYFEKPANQEPSMVYQNGGIAPKTLHKIDVTRIVRDSSVNNDGVVTIMIEALSDLKNVETPPANIYTQNVSDEADRPSLLVDNVGAPRLYQNFKTIMPQLDTYYYTYRPDNNGDTYQFLLIDGRAAYNRVGLIKFNLKDSDTEIANSNLIELEFFEAGSTSTIDNWGTLNANGDLMYVITALTPTDINKIQTTTYNGLKASGYLASDDSDKGMPPKAPIVVAEKPVTIRAGKGGKMFVTKRTIDVTEYIKNVNNQCTDATGAKYVMFRIDFASSAYGIVGSIRSSEFNATYSPKLSMNKVTGKNNTDYLAKQTTSLYPSNAARTKIQDPKGVYTVYDNILLKKDVAVGVTGFIEFPIDSIKTNINNADSIKLELSHKLNTGTTGGADRNMCFDVAVIPVVNIPTNGLTGLTYNIANAAGMFGTDFTKLKSTPFTAYTCWGNSGNPYNVYEQRYQIDVTNIVKAKALAGEKTLVLRLDESLGNYAQLITQLDANPLKRPKLVLNIPQYDTGVSQPAEQLNQTDPDSDTYVDLESPDNQYGTVTKMEANSKKVSFVSFPLNRISGAFPDMTTPTIHIRTSDAKNGIGKLYKLNVSAPLNENDTFNTLKAKGYTDLSNATLVTSFNIIEGTDWYDLDLSSIINDIKACNTEMTFAITTDNDVSFYTRQSLNTPIFKANKFTADSDYVNFANQNIKVQNNNVMGNMILPNQLFNGVVANWTSSTPDVIDNTGVYKMPDTTQRVTLDVSLQKSNFQVDKSYDVNVLGIDYFSSLLQTQYEACDIVNRIITADFVMPSSTNEFVIITWSSDNSAITINGDKAIVTRGVDDINVVLTATISASIPGIVTITKQIPVRVSKIQSQKSGGNDSGGISNAPKTYTPSMIIPPSSDIKPNNEIKPTFSDVSNDHWAYMYIAKLFNAGVVLGVDSTNFEPDRNVLREEFTKLIVNGLQITSTQNSPLSFKEIPDNWWAKEYIRIAYNTKIIGGMPDGTFGMGQPITRQDMAVIVYREMKVKGYLFKNSNADTFNDGDMIADYAKEAVYALRSIKVINGYNNNFMPTNTATRAEASKIICILRDMGI